MLGVEGGFADDSLFCVACQDILALQVVGFEGVYRALNRAGDVFVAGVVGQRALLIVRRHL